MTALTSASLISRSGSRGVLTVYDMGPNTTRAELYEDHGLERGQSEFKAAYERLRANGGGLISIYYHPAEWVHREFWDAVNFARGANPPREEWRPPPQRSAAETEAAFKRFEAYIDFQRSLGVHYVTASDLPRIYHDRLRESGAEASGVQDIAVRISSADAVDVLRDPAGEAWSASDQFGALTLFLAQAIADGHAPAHVPVPGLLGPVDTAPSPGSIELPWAAFRDAVTGAADEVRADGHVPGRVFVGATGVAPADFMRAEAGVVAALEGGTPRLAFPERVRIPQGTRLAAARFVAQESPELFGDWVIHPAGFRAPHIMEQARLQAWTLKPAERR
jgi:hypothetical protein